MADVLHHTNLCDHAKVSALARVAPTGWAHWWLPQAHVTFLVC